MGPNFWVEGVKVEVCTKLKFTHTLKMWRGLKKYYPSLGRAVSLLLLY